MSHWRKVYLQRERNRETERRRKLAKLAAHKAGVAGLGFSAARRVEKQEEGGAGWFKRLLSAMDPRTWKSKSTLAYEAAVQAEKEKREAAEKAKKEATQ